MIELLKTAYTTLTILESQYHAATQAASSLTTSQVGIEDT